MRRIATLLALFIVCMVNSQAFKGKGDIKAQVGASLQSGGTGLFISSDIGLGENISIGAAVNYLLSANTQQVYGLTIEEPKFVDKFDLKARFNANIGNVFKLDPKMDIYPGLDLGLRNLGLHAGFRYFFTDGFGVFGEAGVPIASYNDKNSLYSKYNNQFTFNVGASFNL
jgi:hypothetical protein